MRKQIARALDPLLGPVEYEAEVGYPGAPGARSAPGGETPRRLLHALSRWEPLRELALDAALAGRLSALLGGRPWL